MFRSEFQHIRTGPGAAVLVAILLVSMVSSAHAQAEVGDFKLRLSEKEMNLEHPDDMMWQKYLMWDLPFQRMNDRNMPYLELTNEADATAPITQFRMTIGDPRFRFEKNNMGMFAMLASSTPGFQLTSSAPGGNELIVNIGNGGLQPGELVRFKIDLGVDAQFADQFFAHPDYRTVLFDMNGVNVYDGFVQEFSSDDNAKISVLYNPTVGNDFTVGFVALVDAVVPGAAADIFNNNYRDYRDMDPVRTFQANGSFVIPEPGTAVLALIGPMIGLASARRPRRRAVA